MPSIVKDDIRVIELDNCESLRLLVEGNFVSIQRKHTCTEAVTLVSRLTVGQLAELRNAINIAMNYAEGNL